MRSLARHRATRLITLGVVGPGLLFVVVWLLPLALYPAHQAQRRSAPTQVQGSPTQVQESQPPYQPRATLQAGLLAVGAATIALFGVRTNVVPARDANELTRARDERTHERETAEQRSTRFTAAIDQLGSENSTIRLGGLYGLERIAVEADTHRGTVVEVLSAFVRGYSRPTLDSSGTAELRPIPIDMQAALTILGRLPDREDIEDARRADLTGVDLTGALLVGANLARASLDRVNLTGARLVGATLTGATLVDANLTFARLDSANLVGASLERAILERARLDDADLTRARLFDARLIRTVLIGADLTGATLMIADLTGAQLIRANLARADLDSTVLNGADLTDARGLVPGQLDEAIGDARTKLSRSFRRPSRWPPVQ